MSTEATPYEHASPVTPQVDDRPPSVNTRIEGKNVRRLINTSGAHELRAIAHALEDQRQAWRERALKAEAGIEASRSEPPQEGERAEGLCECGHEAVDHYDVREGGPPHCLRCCQTDSGEGKRCGHPFREARLPEPRTPESPAPSEAVTVSRVGLPTDAVTRVEVVGDGGRLLVKRPVSDVSVELQDGGRTLKVFLREPVEPTTVESSPEDVCKTCGAAEPCWYEEDGTEMCGMWGDNKPVHPFERASSGEGESPVSEPGDEWTPLPTSRVWAETRRALTAALKDRDHWKANHDHQVEMKRRATEHTSAAITRAERAEERATQLEAAARAVVRDWANEDFVISMKSDAMTEAAQTAAKHVHELEKLLPESRQTPPQQGGE